jgi:serine/threonine protein kinase
MFDAESLIGKDIYQFRIEKFLARGAVGLVFRGRDKILNRTVALKLIPKDDDLPIVAEARRRFVQEAQAVGRLSHPNIVGIYSYGETDEFQYICMEYLEGRTLGEILLEEKRISLERAFSLFKQVLSAVDESYRAGIVHRDLKPMNLMVTNEGMVKVMDFGLAKVPSLSLTSAGTILGTPYYMSPEQITGRKVDIRSDIFSIGAVLYQALTGERPFEADTSTSLAYMIVNVNPVPPNITVSDLPESICEIVMKAMAKDPAQRYQKPTEMLDALVGAEEELPSESKATQFENTVISEAQVVKGGREDEFEPDWEEPEPTKSHRLEPAAPPQILHQPAVLNGAIGGTETKRPTTGRTFRNILVSLLILTIGAVAGAYLSSSGMLKVIEIGLSELSQRGFTPQNLPYEGKYKVEGIRPNGTRYEGTATLSRSGDRFSLVWSIDNQLFSGSGVFSGKQLSISWTLAAKPGGVMVYTVNANGSLSAVWGEGKGTETLMPIR